MFSSLFKQLAASMGVVVRTFRSFFTRQITGIWARVKSVTSLTRQASKLAPKMLKTATLAGKKPTKREDYVETERMFIAKSFFVILGIVIVAAALLIYFLVWPFLLSRFFTAKLWVEDKDVADYNGKVVLFYDSAKENIRFHGRLEEGVATGAGELYDEDGLLIYSGDYAGGLYEGEGGLYEAGVLRYKGGFAAGQFDGMGTLYDAYGDVVYVGDFAAGVCHGSGRSFENGEPVYEGTFTAGEYDGSGCLYENGALIYKGGFTGGVYDGAGTEYKDGDVLYKGDFAEGLYNGQGVEYFPGGRVKYRGGFMDGLYADEGVLYNEDGSTKYAGTFLEGLYSGTGSLYPVSGQRVDAEFESGTAKGTIQWYMDGRLCYEGAADGLTPNGTGTFYSTAGAELFTGEMAMGTVDAAALLGLEVNDVRAMLADSTLVETVNGDKGFLVTGEELGLSLFCSFQTEDAASTVYYAYLYDSGDRERFTSPVIWADRTEFEQWLEQTDAGEYTKTSCWTASEFPDGLPFDNGAWFCTSYVFDGRVCTLWSMERGGELLLVEWHTGQAVPEAEELSGAGDASASGRRLDSLLAVMKKEYSGSATAGVPACAYYGSDPLAETLAAAPASGETLYTGVSAMLDYFEKSELRTAAESNLELITELRDDEKELVKKGTGSEKLLKELNGNIESLKLIISKYEAEMQKDKTVAGSALNMDPASYQLQELLLLFDPEKLDRDELTQAALKAAGVEEPEPAEEAPTPSPGPSPEPTVEPTIEPTAEPTPDAGVTPEPVSEMGLTVRLMETTLSAAEAEALKVDVDLAYIELELAYQEFSKAKDDYESACESLEEVQKQFQLSAADKKDVYDALCFVNELRSELYTELTRFTSCAMELDRLCGGFLSEKYGWLQGVFA